MGVPFHGEFSSADASALSEANSRFTLYGAGSTTAITLNANDQIEITDISIASAGTNLTVQVYDGADATVDAGEAVYEAIVPTNTTQSKIIGTPHVIQKGTYPKLKTSGAGQVDAVIHGRVVRLGS